MFFITGKLLWSVLQPGNLLLILLVLGLLLATWRLRRVGRTLVVLATLGFVLIAAFPVGAALMLVLEQRFPRPASLPGRIDGIIVLGGAVDERVSRSYGETMFNNAAGRVLTAVDLARRHPEARLAIVGGEGSLMPTGYAESQATLGFARQSGIAPDRIMLEERSRSTRENGLYAFELLQPRPGETWVLVTSAFHMPRSVGVFRALNWPVLPYAADYRIDPASGLVPEFSLSEGLSKTNIAAKEWVGLAAYRIRGWTDSLVPGP